ncbi:uncharacterized protein EURHEDRAFT_448739 [Aspergillus ruber CBS 135680]|uniref:Mmc1 C-terminal domain-containing protein n=1 Tax=Aspergillus ruber (strain CBS 135680) TaxID=1388766 RepID=A0A017SNB2_ASPRC|nr:uncharacterized protein EURHEDRAFT_448739 [Aspergillus ruber CBS 135680]EYE98463.1 hypothetical protein EURHEDRAFT_448739 [Aspergillus ruber CBS 135680]
MPPNLRGSLPKSLSRPLDSGGVFYCPSCSTWRRTISTRRRTYRSGTSTTSSGIIPPGRYGELNIQRQTFTTSAAINAGKNVPPRFKELYAALNRIGDVATDRVNLSRLQLALRGLESEEPLVRVAVLGLNDTNAARRLVRLLLSDPLSSREDWEDMLEGYEADTSRGLLIRYGEECQNIPNNLLPTISIPSQLLKKANMEILVSNLGAEADSSVAQFTADTFLVPTVTIRTSHSGRHNVVRYPVHKSIVCGSGMEDLVSYSGLITRSDLKREKKSVYGAIEMEVSDKERRNDRFAFVDIKQAEESLSKFRESVQNASLYERGWNSSGVQPVVDWLTSMRESGESLDPSLKTLILSLLDAAEEGVLAKEAWKAQEQQSASVSEEVRTELDRSVGLWAERAHSELRSSLEEGFASKRWRGLAWWKLFLRVDDVSMLTSEILERRYLQGAEKEVIWTAGQLQQAGLMDDLGLSEPSEVKGEQQALVEQTSPPVPWPVQISTSRTRLLNTTVPALQALAQRLVLFSLSTTSLTSALSGLTYFSFPTASVYETCTLAAVGLVYSLRRQQTKWERAREFWEDEVREEGRTALRSTEEQLQTLVQEGGRPAIESTEDEARETIEQARKAVEDMDVKSTPP